MYFVGLLHLSEAMKNSEWNNENSEGDLSVFHWAVVHSLLTQALKMHVIRGLLIWLISSLCLHFDKMQRELL